MIKIEKTISITMVVDGDHLHDLKDVCRLVSSYLDNPTLLSYAWAEDRKAAVKALVNEIFFAL